MVPGWQPETLETPPGGLQGGQGEPRALWGRRTPSLQGLAGDWGQAAGTGGGRWPGELAQTQHHAHPPERRARADAHARAAGSLSPRGWRPARPEPRSLTGQRPGLGAVVVNAGTPRDKALSNTAKFLETESFRIRG